MTPSKASKTDQQTPPKRLSKGAKRLWQAVASSYELENHHFALLAKGCEQLTRADQARDALAGESLVVKDRFGQPKANPLIEIERQASLAAKALLRELGLDVEAVEPSKRGYSRRGA